jgi:hypothetical protein
MKWTNSLKPQVAKLTEEETDYLNSVIATIEIEFVVKNLLTKKSPDPDDFTNEIYQLRQKYQLFPNSSRRVKMRKYFLTHTMRLSLPSSRPDNLKKGTG